MMKNFLLAFLFAFISCYAVVAQNTAPVVSESELNDLIEKSKNAWELSKLNELRIKMREIEFAKLPSTKAKELYAEAYRQLAVSHRNHRYIRPGYELLLKYISLKDLLLEEEKNRQLAELQSVYMTKISKLDSTITSRKALEKSLETDKTSLSGLKRNSFMLCSIVTLLLAGIFYYILSKLNRQYAEAKLIKENCYQNIREKSSEIVKGQMSVGVLLHSKIINSDILAESSQIAQYVTTLDNEFRQVKETEVVFKNAKDNISRIRQLSEINENSLSSFLNSLKQ